MNALTWGDVKKYVEDAQETKDSDPVYIVVATEDEEAGTETGTVYALQAVSWRCGGGEIQFTGYEDGMDAEDEANLL